MESLVRQQFCLWKKNLSLLCTALVKAGKKILPNNTLKTKNHFWRPVFGELNKAWKILTDFFIRNFKFYFILLRMWSVLKTPEILCKSKLLLKIINNIACVCVGERERDREKDYACVLRYFKLACHFKIISVSWRQQKVKINK